MFSDSQLGNPHSKLWIVSSCPKNGEESPMSTQNNSWLMSYLYGQGLTLEDIRIEYLVNDVPRRGGMEYFHANGSLRRGVQELKERIALYKPNIVLGLGSDVLFELLGQRDVSKWRGHVLLLECGVKALFTFDPVAAHRQRFVAKGQKPGQYATLLKLDLRNAIKEHNYPETRFHPTPVHICTRYGETVERLQAMLEEAHFISFDIEVLEPYEGRLMDCISLASEKHDSLCIPFWRSTGDPKDKKSRGIERVWKREHEFVHIFGLVKRILESNIQKVAQNSQYDITTLEYYYGIKVRNLVWDTMVAAHSVFCDLPKDLGTLISLYTNIPYHKYLIHSARTMDRWEYSAADGIANLHVMSGQKKEMGELDGICGYCTGSFEECLSCTKVMSSQLYKHYRTTVNPIIEHCIGMHVDGVTIDTKVRDTVLELEKGYQEAILRALHKVIPVKLSPKKYPYNVNPKSTQQMATLFYDLLHSKTIYDKGKVSFNDHARETIKETDKRYFIQTLLRACDEYIYSDASILKFKVELDGGKMRTKYEPAGADTGRLKSKKSDVLSAGTNLQNVEKGQQRAAIIPDNKEENIFLHADLYAAEAFLNFLDAGELDGLKRISGLLPEQQGKYPYEEKYGCRVMTTKVSDGLKIHNWLFDWIKERFPEVVKKVGFKYKDAKQLIHAMNYDVKVDKMSSESGLPLYICQEVYQMYHTKYPGIQDRMRRIQTDIRRNSMLNTPLGRRRYFLADPNDQLFKIAYAWPSQSTIGEIDNRAMCSCRVWSERGTPLNKTKLNTHDGLVNEIKKGTKEEAIQRVLNAFNQRLTLNGLTIVIPVSIGFGPNFNEVNDEHVYFYPLEI